MVHYIRLRNKRLRAGMEFGRHAKGWKKPKDYIGKRKTRRRMAKKSRQRNAAKLKGRS
jgi:hypothetical protein